MTSGSIRHTYLYRGYACARVSFQSKSDVCILPAIQVCAEEDNLTDRIARRQLRWHDEYAITADAAERLQLAFRRGHPAEGAPPPSVSPSPPGHCLSTARPSPRSR
eukprot:scaffold9180_cov35-Tisochrysis_lutea.AAC.7